MSIFAWILTLAMVAGQLIRIPTGQGAVTALDLVVLFFIIFNLVKINFKKMPFFIKTAFLFMAVASLSLLATPLQLTIQEKAVSFSYTLRFFCYIMFGWIFKDRLIEILKLSGVALAILGLLQLIFFRDLSFLSILGWDPHYFRVVSTFLDPNFAGAFFVLTLILVRKNYFMFAIVYLALLLTFSRSSYGMFFISFTTLALILKSWRLQTLTILLFGVLLFSFFLYSRFISLPRNIDRTTSASFRINTWTQGWQLFEKHPILGVGFNAYRYAIRDYKLADPQFLTGHGSNSNDSSLLFIASTTGITGLFSFLFFLFSISRNRLMISTLAGLLFHSFFANSLFFPPILLWLIFAATADKAD